MLKRYNKTFKKLQKKRIFDKTIITFLLWLNFKHFSLKTTYYLFFYRTFFIKFRFFKKLRRVFRKWLKRRRLKIFFFCHPNFLVHSKFKNARMGKGKGAPQYWIYKANPYKPLESSAMGFLSKTWREEVVIQFWAKWQFCYFDLWRLCQQSTHSCHSFLLRSQQSKQPCPSMAKRPSNMGDAEQIQVGKRGVQNWGRLFAMVVFGNSDSQEITRTKLRTTLLTPYS